MFHRFKLWMIGAFVALLAFGGVALAANTVDPTDGSADLAKSVYDAIAGGHYAYAIALAVILAIGLIKRWSGSTWLHTDAGHVVMAFALSTATALSASLAGGGSLTVPLAESALLVGVGAVGGYKVLEALAIPYLKAWQSKASPTIQKLMQYVLFIWNTQPVTPADPPAPASK